ncbi:protein FAM177A1 isoform X1 [Astyanax mexicanus]|uniref:protein FAM177A1 isoform X1 n=1 Tax=Astyanax mexicanus TaxID=7994 RepID=UPI0020CAA8D5|nr:protein FAM177A1 isoform X1 [Astyanax mexicanus]
MSEISLFLINASVAVTENTGTEKGSSKGKDFECVELGELEDKDQSTEKTPRRIIHFSSGETMEEYSTEEEDNSEKHPEKKDLLSPIDTSKLTWGPYVWFQMWRAATSTVSGSACDYLGERMASLFGITSAKYQYAIDEFDRMKEKDKDVEESHLSEEAESRFEEPHSEKKPKLNQPETPPTQASATTEASSTLSTVSVHVSHVST